MFCLSNGGISDVEFSFEKIKFWIFESRMLMIFH